jgi:hypothetical protein
LQVHSANLVFDLQNNTSIGNPANVDSQRFFHQCKQAAAANAAMHQVPNEHELGAIHQAVLGCLRGQSALEGCSINPEVLVHLLLVLRTIR